MEATVDYSEESKESSKEKTPEPLKKELTKWANEPTVANLKQDLTEVTSSHSAHVQKVNIWLDNLHVTGKAAPTKKAGYSSVQPKLIRKQAEWRYAALSEPFLSTTDLFSASPVTFEDKKSAEQNQLLLNTQFRKDIDRVKFIDSYVRTAVDEGTVILRTGWEYEDRTDEIEVPVYAFRVDNSPEAAQMMEGLAQQFQQDPQALAQQVPPELLEALNHTIESGEVVIPYIEKYEKEDKITVLVNRPTLEICNFNDVMIDPTCKGDIDKANFVIYRFITSISELKKAGKKYVNLDHINENDANSILAMADSSATSTSDASSFTFKDKPRKKFYAYEYWGFWDIEGDGVLQPIVGTFVNNTMIRMEENPFPDKKVPFEVVAYLPIKESLYGEPDGVLIEDNQKISGAVTRGMIDVMGRSANGQQGIRKDALDPVNKRRYDRGEDYEFNPQVDPRQAFYMHTYPEIPQSALLMLNLQNAEAESLTGVKAYSGGISGEALGDVAAGIRGVLDAASKRELGILRRLAGGIVKIGHKFTSMNAEWLSEEEVIRVTNEEFVPVKRDDLAGKIDLSLKITTAEEDNQKAQELAFMLQTIGPNSDPGEVRMIRAEIARLRKMPDLAKRIEEYQPEPDPMAQEIQMLQIEKLKKEIAHLDSKMQENMANAAYDQARAANVSSDTDLKNLNFVEQETGTKHARDVDKITSQAKAQAAKSVVESQFKK